MQKPLVRLALVLLALVAAAGAGYKLVLLDRDAAASREAWKTFETRVADAAAYAAELRAAQRGYVAQGQGEQFWMTRVTALADAVKGNLALLAADSRSPDAARSLSDAATALVSFQRLDITARSYVTGGQRLMASDLIFGEGLETLRTIAAGIDEARTRERDARERASALERRTGAYVLLASAGVVFGVLLLLAATPGPRREKAPTSLRLWEAQRVAERAAMLDLDVAPTAGAPAWTTGGRQPGDLPLQRKGAAAPRDGTSATPDAAGSREEAAPAPAAPAPSPGAAVPESPGTPRPAPALDAPPVTTLLVAARLCADLARVAEAQELPGLLQRVASLLDASGVIVWLRDASGAELRPAVSHGYSPAAMSRMRALPRDADNATAAAYRSGDLRVVPADAGANGALVVPLITSAGPVGAMSVEIRHGRETNTAFHALAVLIAAQIATLVAVGPGK